MRIHKVVKRTVLCQRQGYGKSFFVKDNSQEGYHGYDIYMPQLAYDSRFFLHHVTSLLAKIEQKNPQFISERKKKLLI